MTGTGTALRRPTPEDPLYDARTSVSTWQQNGAGATEGKSQQEDSSGARFVRAEFGCADGVSDQSFQGRQSAPQNAGGAHRGAHARVAYEDWTPVLRYPGGPRSCLRTNAAESYQRKDHSERGAGRYEHDRATPTRHHDASPGAPDQ